MKHEDAKDFEPSAALEPYNLAFFIVLLIIGIKAYAYAVSGSASMLGSLVDSLGDIVITCFTFFTIRLSLKPADEKHRYGHGKAEGFSALLQACFLTSGAIFMILEIGHRLFVPADISNHYTGIAVSLLSILLTVIIVFLQKKAYRSAPSLALKADQSHYSSDIWLNMSVVVSYAVNLMGNFTYVDSIIGLGIAIYILKTAKEVGCEALNMLMDAEIDEQDRQKILDIVEGDERVFGIHDLRTRQSGMSLYISFDVELEPTLSLEEAHKITHDLDMKILKIFPNAEILIHKDPKGDIHDSRHKVSGVHI